MNTYLIIKLKNKNAHVLMRLKSGDDYYLAVDRYIPPRYEGKPRWEQKVYPRSILDRYNQEFIEAGSDEEILDIFNLLGYIHE